VIDPVPPPARTVRADHCEIQVSDTDGATRLTVRGEFDRTSAWMLAEALRPGAHLRVVVDLAHTDFVDAAGLRALARSADRCSASGGWLDVVGARPFQRLLITRVGLGHLLGRPGASGGERPDSPT
jgi:anti-anti-sigma factor